MSRRKASVALSAALLWIAAPGLGRHEALAALAVRPAQNGQGSFLPVFSPVARQWVDSLAAIDLVTALGPLEAALFKAHIEAAAPVLAHFLSARGIEPSELQDTPGQAIKAAFDAASTVIRTAGGKVLEAIDDRAGIDGQDFRPRLEELRLLQNGYSAFVGPALREAARERRHLLRARLAMRLGQDGIERLLAGSARDPGESTRWFPSGLEETKGVAVVASGLNARPSKMNDIVRLLNEGGVDVLRLAWHGHRGDWEEFAAVDRETLLRDARDAYQAAATRARALGTPLFFVGVSMGALITLDMVNSPGPAARYDRMVLFSPAIALRLPARIVGISRWLPRRLPIPSLNFDDYRWYRWTPAAAYRTVALSLAALRRSGLVKAGQPTLVLIDPGDETVSPSGIRRLIRSSGLTRWKLNPISTAGTLLPRRWRHLNSDEKAVGTAEWGRISLMIRKHLGLTEPSP